MSSFRVQDKTGFRQVLVPRLMTIGRSHNNDLMLDATFASRRHAWVWQQGNQVLLEDLGSRHGTFVNGQRVATPCFLNSNDVISMGEANLTFVAEQGPSRAQSPSPGAPQQPMAHRSLTPTEPVVIRPFPSPAAKQQAGTDSKGWILILFLAILCVILLTIVGMLLAIG